jgi:hypothetical protein
VIHYLKFLTLFNGGFHGRSQYKEVRAKRDKLHEEACRHAED